VKNFENRLRFEKVIAKSLVASFFYNTFYYFGHERDVEDWPVVGELVLSSLSRL